ncbi:PIN domain-containing protein [Mannheimia indoligenes]|uniref:PIN domain-containing protein n=1 Tax=Mannheimia indoligenes TaxID=3103145 RepID=UPI002FE5828A
MIYMLDTNILIYLMKNRPLAVAERVQLTPSDQLVMSFITYGELLKGANGSANFTKAFANIEKLT